MKKLFTYLNSVWYVASKATETEGLSHRKANRSVLVARPAVDKACQHDLQRSLGVQDTTLRNVPFPKSG